MSCESIVKPAGGIVRVNKSPSPVPLLRKKTRWEAVCLTCKSNGKIDGVDGSSALRVLSSRLRNIFVGSNVSPGPQEFRHSCTDLGSKSLCGGALHTATNRREACWRQSGKSKVLDDLKANGTALYSPGVATLPCVYTPQMFPYVEDFSVSRTEVSSTRRPTLHLFRLVDKFFYKGRWVYIIRRWVYTSRPLRDNEFCLLTVT